jgi:hypothetical protein
MDLSPYVTSVEENLLAAAAAGDEGTRRTAGALATAVEPSVRLALMNALAEVALDVTDALGDRVVELRLDGGDVRIVVSPLPDTEGEPDGEFTETADQGGSLSRVTLRLPDELKTAAERAAAAHGISLNTWLSRAVRDALRGGSARPEKRHEPAHRVRGWVQG